MERQQEQVKKKGKEEKQTEEISTRCSIINRKGHSGKIEREGFLWISPTYYLVPCQHVHLRACGGVCVERLHLFVKMSLCAVKFGLFSLELHDFSLQFLHVGVLNCALQLTFLKRKMHINTHEVVLPKHMAPYVMYEIDTAMDLVFFQYLAWDKLSVKKLNINNKKKTTIFVQ